MEEELQEQKEITWINIFSSTPSFKKKTFLLSQLFFHLFFFSNLFIAFQAKLLTNLGKLSQAEGVARSVITFLPKLPNYMLRRNPLD